MAFRTFLKLSSLTAAGYTAYVLQQNDWDPKNIGIVRFGRAAYAVGTIAFDYKQSVSGLNDDSDETLLKWSNCHTRSARRLLKLCCQNGGSFIKVGQHIAALDYLVPKEYVDVLKVLHNQGPTTEYSDICEVIKSELGQDIDEIFEDFEKEPVGAASLAQVHKARLRETKELVAVKIQHPKVFRHSIVDIATMEFLFGVVSKIFPDFSFMWLADETRRNLPVELDFYHEGKNAELMSSLLKQFNWLKIPKIHWKYTTKRTLVMEFIEGGIISDRDYIVKNKIDPIELTNRLELIYSQMIFIYGVVHCDPHPGNILVCPKGNDFDVALLDHGLYTTLTEDFRKNYCQFWFALLQGNVKEIESCAIKMGIKKENAKLLSCMITAKPWSSIAKGLSNTDPNMKDKEKDELRRNASSHMETINKILSDVDRQLLLLMKTNDLIRSIGTVMGCDERRSFLTMTHSCIEVVQTQKYAESSSIFHALWIILETKWMYLKLSLYSLYLWFDSFISDPNSFAY